MLGLNSAQAAAFACMVFGALGLLLPLHFYGLLDNADNFTVFKCYLFTIYGYYGGFIFFQLFKKKASDD